tara:strand:+ start:679 stop:888 length:210 start_codon:yes stop_codon:yes gene_type:complete
MPTLIGVKLLTIRNIDTPNCQNFDSDSSKNRAKNDHKKIYAPIFHFGMEFANARFVPNYIKKTDTISVT